MNGIMAICRKCNREVSYDNKRCPYCLTKIKKYTGTNMGGFGRSVVRIIALLVFIGTGIVGFIFPAIWIMSIICLAVAIWFK